MDIVPIFKTSASIGRSILTADDEIEIKDNAPVSIFGIASKYKLDKLTVIDDTFLNFPTLYKNCNKYNIHLIFGVNFHICNDVNQKNDESLFSNCKIAVLMKNGQGYKDLIKLHNAINSIKENFYYTPRGDWKIINKYWTENLELFVGPYNSFIEKNLLENGCCIPEFGKIKPIFSYTNQELPFTEILNNQITSYAKNNNYELIESHPIFYYKTEDFKCYQIIRTINNRSKFRKPDLDFLSSDCMSFQKYWEKIGNKL